MKKLLAAIFCILFLVGCQTSQNKTTTESEQPQSSMSLESEMEETSSSSEKEVAFEDSLGNTITISNPQRVAALMGSYAEIWSLAGGDPIATTADAWDERQMELEEDKVTNLGGVQEPSLELLLGAKPDFVIASTDIESHVAMKETLESAGIPVAYFKVETVEDYLTMLKICTEITGRDDLYQENGEAVKQQVEECRERAKNEESPLILYIRAYSTGAKAKGSDNLTGAMLKDLGCINLADSDNSLLEDVSLERIIEADPDYIFVTTMGSSEKALEALAENMTNNPAWANLSAVKNGRYHVLPKDLFHYKPNARWGEAYEILADILYPEE